MCVYRDLLECLGILSNILNLNIIKKKRNNLIFKKSISG